MPGRGRARCTAGIAPSVTAWPVKTARRAGASSRQQTAEADIVTGGADSGDDALLGEADENVERHLHMRAHQRHSERGTLIWAATVRGALNLGGIGQRIERRGHDGCVTADGQQTVGFGEDAGRRLLADAHEDGHPAGGGLDRGGEDEVALGVRQVRDLAGGPEHEDSVHTAGDEVVDEGGQPGAVDLTVRGARGQQRGDDAVEISHGRVLTCRTSHCSPRRPRSRPEPIRSSGQSRRRLRGRKPRMRQAPGQVRWGLGECRPSAFRRSSRQHIVVDAAACSLR